MPQFSLDWKPVLLSGTDTNDSDQTFEVPANTWYRPISVFVSYASTATAGSRQLEIQFRDTSDGIISRRVASVTQAASLTYTYDWNVNNPDGLSLRDSTFLPQLLPYHYLPAGYDIRVFDNNAVAAAADDLTIRITVESYDIVP
jgi:hypothetical protein